MNTGSAVVTLATFLALSALITKGVDHFRSLDRGDRVPKFYWQASAFVLGIVVAFGLRLDGMALLRDAINGVLAGNGAGDAKLVLPKVAPWLGRLVTGLMLGAWSSGIHDWLSGKSAPATTPKGLALPTKPAVKRTPVRRKPRPAQPVAPPEPRG